MTRISSFIMKSYKACLYIPLKYCIHQSVMTSPAKKPRAELTPLCGYLQDITDIRLVVGTLIGHINWSCLHQRHWQHCYWSTADVLQFPWSYTHHTSINSILAKLLNKLYRLTFTKMHHLTTRFDCTLWLLPYCIAVPQLRRLFYII